jgi:hypothetical protein
MQLDTQQLDAWAVKRVAETLPMTETKPAEPAATAVAILRMIAKKHGALDESVVNVPNAHQPDLKQVSSAS